jgi:signal transduction histidine kinase
MLLRARVLLARLAGVDRVRVDELAGLVLLAGIELQLWLGGPVQHRALEAAAGAVLAVAVAVRRRWPLAAVFASLAALTTLAAPGGRPNHHGPGGLVAAVLVFYAMGAFVPWRRSLWALALTLMVSSVSVLSTPGKTVWDLCFAGIVVVLLPWALGCMLRRRAAGERSHREMAERLDAAREQHAQAAAYRERARLARELHDVIAHSVSVMVIQAGGARLVMDRAPERAEASLRSVERAGREALAEMRRLLGVLDGGRGPRALAPQPGLADIEDLLSGTHAPGLTTELHIDGTPVTVPPALDLCAYRIVQEALTNAIKYARPARAKVHIRWRLDTLELEISDDGRGPVPAKGTSGGHGIAGMRERAALHGGRIHAGAGASGGFTVRARLPLAPERAG